MQTTSGLGAIHGTAYLVERRIISRNVKDKNSERPIKRIIGWVYTMTIVFTAWAFFRAENVGQAWNIVSDVLGPISL